jgi:hypothetical protein
MIVALAIAGGLAVGAAAIVLLRRSRRVESGVEQFRRHIDALSPEARREVMDRVRGNDDGKTEQ